MATIDQCLTALTGVLDGLAGQSAARGLDRTVSCRLTDLRQVLRGHLTDGKLRELHAEDDVDGAPKADIRLTMSSDDLLALTSGSLSFGTAWASGRVKLDAGFRDLLRLRSLL